MLLANPKPVSCREALASFDPAKAVIESSVLRFAGVGDRDVYNPSVPFMDEGCLLLAGRVESRDSEASQTVFFHEVDGVWTPKEGLPTFELQDPFVATIGGQLVFGGVRVIWEGGRITSWVTDFYKGSCVRHLSLFATGPRHMKDIRLVELADGRVGIFSRPLGDAVKAHGVDARARIGFTVVDRLDEVTAEVMERAPLLDGHFLPDEWGGVNQPHLLANGLIGAVGHKSYMTTEGGYKLHYHSMVFVIDPISRAMSECKPICTRECFPAGPAKRPDLVDVTFTAGLIRNADGTATLYTGLSDCQVGKATIPDPFLEYE